MDSQPLFRSFGLALLIVATVASGGCEEESVRTYRVAKTEQTSSVTPRLSSEGEGPAADAGAPSGASSGASSGGQMADQPVPPREVNPDQLPVRWQVPEGWTEAANPNRFRVRTYHIPPTSTGEGAAQPIEVAISSLSGDGGGLVANLNRWRGQIGLAPVQSLEHLGEVVRFQSEQTRGVFFDMTSERVGGDDGSAQRMFVAVVRTPQRTWFVKSVGAAERMASHREAVLEFARSFRWLGGEGAGTDANRGRVADGMNPHAGASGTGASASASSGDEAVQWRMPEAWHEAANTPAMLHSAFHAPADGVREPAQVSVVPLPGRAGGALANVNRWRRQLNLPPIERLSEQGVEQLDLADGAAQLVAISQPGEAPTRQRTIAAWTQRGEMTWFFKMTGPAAAVAAHEQNFRAFVRSVTFGASQ